jgi:hypothetical protein
MQARHKIRKPGLFVVLMEAYEGFVNLNVSQKLRGAPRVLSYHGIAVPENFGSPIAQITQISNRRGNESQGRQTHIFPRLWVFMFQASAFSAFPVTIPRKPC